MARIGTLALTFALLGTSLATPDAVAATADLRTALRTMEGDLEVVAASGSSILTRTDAGYRLSQDSGATWTPASPELGDPNFRYIADGKGVFTGGGEYPDPGVKVFSLTNNTVESYSWGANLAAYNLTTGVEEVSPGEWIAIDLKTGSDRWLTVPAVPAAAPGYSDWSSFVMGSESAVHVTKSNHEETGAVGDGYLAVVPLAGGAGPAPVQVAGLETVVVAGDDVVYSASTATGWQFCRRALTMIGAPACTVVPVVDPEMGGNSLTASRSWTLVETSRWGEGHKAILFESSASTPVQLPTGEDRWYGISGTGDPTRPLVSIESATASSIQRVNADGSLSKLFGFPQGVPAVPLRLALSPTHVYGGDARPTRYGENFLAWSRSVSGSAFGAEALLPTRASQVWASAGRLTATTAVGVQVFDRGALSRTLPASIEVLKLSGPYYLYETWDAVAQHYVRNHSTTTGQSIAGTPLDIFGSLALDVVDAASGRYQVRDVAKPSAPSLVFTLPAPYNNDSVFHPEIWGDWVTFVVSDGGLGTLAYNYRTGAHKVHSSDFSVALGDGFGVLANEHSVWDFRSDRVIPLEPGPLEAAVATDGSHRVAYSTATELVVRTLEGTGTSAPRILGILAPTTFDLGAGGAWTPEIDVTKPLQAGTLVIKSGSTVIRTLAVPASADGSVRGVSWDGKNAAGTPVNSGTYGYELVANAQDGTGAVKAVDGIAAAGGTLQVTGGPVGTITGTIPTISDTTPSVGQTLSVAPGPWSPSDVGLTFQWFRGSTAIAGATGTAYQVQPADLAATLTVKVTGAKPGYASVTMSSGVTSPVASGVLTSTPTPTISDTTPSVDQTVSAVPGSWAPAGVSVAYQWSRRNATGVTTAITGATNQAYKATAADVGHGLQVKVTGSLTGYTSVSRTSAWTSAVAAASFSSAPTPTITGVARVSMRLTATPGTWSPSATLKYQWYRVSSTGTSTAVTGATGSTYTAVAADRGYRMKVRVVGSRTGYVTVTRYSALTGTVQAPMAGGTPTISDTTPKVDQRLTANTGTWSPSDVTFSYQWYARNSAGTVTTITGATAKTYAVNGKYAGHTLRVRVTGSKTGYAPVSKYSAYTSTVAKATFTTMPTPTITGTAKVGYTLTANPGTWAPTPGAVSYRWYRVNTAGTSTLISGATAAKYTLTAADRGFRVKVSVTATRTGYTTVTKTSALTGSVATGTLTATPTPTIAGTARVGSVLTANPGTWSPSPVTLTYRWYRVTASGASTQISGAAASKYTLTTADRGHRIKVSVTGAKSGYTTVTKTSVLTASIT